MALAGTFGVRGGYLDTTTGIKGQVGAQRFTRIVGIGKDLAASGMTADRTIDAKGKWVIPGGIDVHTHMKLPFGGTFAKDDFFTGTRAAAFGGTTTIVDFAVQSKGKSLREGLDTWHAMAEGNAVVDYGFHMIMSDVTDDSLREMDQLVAEGVPDFKLFTAYPGVFFSDDGAIFRAMQQTGRNGGMIMMHAENGLAIDVIAADYVAAGTTDPIGHGLARYSVLEGEATNRVIRLAEAAGAPVYIVHLSAREALNAVRQAREAEAEAAQQRAAIEAQQRFFAFNHREALRFAELAPEMAGEGKRKALMASAEGNGGFAAGLTVAAFGTLAVLAILWGAAHIGVGVPLRRRRHWSRQVALVLGSIDLLLLPYGTVLGVYALWTLLHAESKALFGGPRA